MPTSIKLNYSHPNAGPAESFINSTDDRFIEDKSMTTEWTQKELVLKEFYFRSTESNSGIHILFFDSQSDAIAFEKANNLANLDAQRSVLNGSALYVIKEADQQKLNELVGLFAGKE